MTGRGAPLAEVLAAAAAAWQRFREGQSLDRAITAAAERYARFVHKTAVVEI